MKSIICYGAKDIRLETTELGQVGADDVLVDIAVGGICGSDLHYYNRGGFGAVRIQMPMILGHEVSGIVRQAGDAVANVKVGDLVAINPSLPCGDCAYCRAAMHNQCIDMRFYGSAMRMPHVHGAFSQKVVAKAKQCFAFSKSSNVHEAACAEPFSVALHAVKRAGSLIGKRVLVTGVGPIGMMVVAAAKLHGAMEIVVTDIVDGALARAQAMGADRAINVATSGDELDVYARGKGYFDVCFECSGNQSAIVSALDLLRPRSRLVQLGLGGDVTLPQNVVVAKEIELCGSFRFFEEFAWAVELIDSGRVNFTPLLTGCFLLEQAVDAFEAALDRNISMKVQIEF
ncbi:L-idonate 5-dehydrogenase [Cohaesibacter intestini]|uniref:L-idonate 5-dehydrogenase n=1 Tax=Cohaesibacter intestini TaxID=2211145 RepID=UPI000DE89886|nr:L-idonate 5-dehydrogenase [Cohaesibacter intestini]